MANRKWQIISTILLPRVRHLVTAPQIQGKAAINAMQGHFDQALLYNDVYKFGLCRADPVIFFWGVTSIQADSYMIIFIPTWM